MVEVAISSSNRFHAVASQSIMRALWMLGVVCLASCDRVETQEIEEPRSEQLTARDLVREFELLFPDALDVISYKANAEGEKDSPVWSWKAGIHERYLLEVEFKVRMSISKSATLEPVPTALDYDPVYRLTEIDRITRRPEGGISYVFSGEAEEFGVEEWKKLWKSKGDFAAIGIELDSTRPLPDFDSLLAGPP